MPDFNRFITLKPLTHYFFGGENFAAEGETAFYLQDSEAFPQQTSLLGLLRHQILLQNGQLAWRDGSWQIDQPQQAALLIGGESFNPDATDGAPTFGIIKALSPLMLVDSQGRQFLPFPKVKSWQTGKVFAAEQTTDQDASYRMPQLTIIDTADAMLMGAVRKQTVPAFEGFDPKLGFAWGFKALEEDLWLTQEEVFETTSYRVGINKPHTLPHRQQEDQPEQEGFFKQTFRRLKAGFAFGAYLEIEEPARLQSQPMVPFGKEQSPFSLEIQGVSDEQVRRWQKPLPSLQPGQQLWLAAPAKVNPAVVAQHAVASIGQQISFRCMVSQVKERFNYYANPRRKSGSNQPLVSQRYNLMDRGTLLWLSKDLSSADIEELTSAFQNPAFQSIGYNYVFAFNP